MIALRQAIADSIQAALPVAHVETHGGRFDAAELKRASTRAPAVFVAVLGVSGLREMAGIVSAEVALGAFVVARSAPDAPRDEAALAMVQTICAMVPGNRWELAATESAPASVRADNLFSSAVDRVGVAMWGVSWRQRVQIEAPDALTLDDLLTVRVALDADQTQDGEPAAEDTITLQGAT